MSYTVSGRSSRTPSVVTPSSTELTTVGYFHLQEDPSDAVPWPGNSYKLIETTTGRALRIDRGTLQTMADSKALEASNGLWLCVEANGYFGLFDQATNLYWGPSGSNVILSGTFGPDQYFVPRRHPKGGYQLLTPAGPNALKQVAALGYNNFVRRQHAGTIWRFVRVSTGDEQAVI